MAFKKKRKVGEDETEEHTDKQEARKDALADMLSDAHQVRRKSKAGWLEVFTGNRPILRIQGFDQREAAFLEACYNSWCHHSGRYNCPSSLWALPAGRIRAALQGPAQVL